MQKICTVSGLLIGLSAWVLLSCGNDKDQAASAQGFNFNLKDLDGQTRTLADYNKKLVLIDFWTTWCIPCRITIPTMNQIYSKYQEDIALVGISLDTADDSVVRDFAKNMGIAYPVLVGGITLAREHGISSIPTLFFVNTKGKILKTHTGVLDATSLEAIINNLI